MQILIFAIYVRAEERIATEKVTIMYLLIDKHLFLKATLF